ncbi:hypothetical protein KSS87_019323 [Heliosperma pusillum]|nr:hypothetical protein KSS87_019323 [Heliosperma pusillum]
MSENPIEAIFQTFQKITNRIQTQLSSFVALQIKINPYSPSHQNPTLLSLSNSPSIHVSSEGKASQPVTKEALGSATWTFLHTLAAQYPERPSRQQKRDVKELMPSHHLRLSAGVANADIAETSWPCHLFLELLLLVLRATLVLR